MSGFYDQNCWLAQHGIHEDGPMPPCDGRLVRVHLIPQQQLKRLGVDPQDARSWVWACGGVVGNAGHHGMLDSSRKLRIPFDRLPAQTIEFAEEVGALPWLEREYRR